MQRERVLFILLLCTCVASSKSSSLLCPAVKRFRNAEDINPRTGSRFPNTLLFSCEGSGNTWTRFLFENATGIWSGSRFFDKSLHLMGFQGEGYTNRSVVVVKTHVDPCPTFKNRHLYAFNKTLHLVRNPFHAIVAERKRLTVRRNFHKANPTWSTFVNGIVGAGDRWRVTSSLPWDAWLDRGMSRWLTTIITVEHAAAQGQPTHTMRFEDLLQDLRGTMADALAFIDEDPQLSTCLHTSDKSTTGRQSVSILSNITNTTTTVTTANQSIKSDSSTSTPTYPNCLYTQQQLQRTLRFLGPKLGEYGYTVPKPCVAVLAGQELGGTDASQVEFAPPDPRPPKVIRHRKHH